LKRSLGNQGFNNRKLQFYNFICRDGAGALIEAVSPIGKNDALSYLMTNCRRPAGSQQMGLQIPIFTKGHKADSSESPPKKSQNFLFIQN
jgi:hypothetical protein